MCDTEWRVPLDAFLARTRSLGRLLTDYRTAVDLADGIRARLAHGQAELAELDRALRGEAPSLSVDEVSALLAGSRFTKRSLESFQERDLARMLSLPHGVNFSVPGAGKTTVAYAAYEAERERGRVEQLLVVAPISAFDAWFTEAEECFEPPPRVERLVGRVPRCEVLLVNYQRLKSRYVAISRWVMEKPTHVILDEAHRMKKGRDGEWGSACLDLAFLAERRDILTGTPAPQHPRDLVALLDYVWAQRSDRILPRSINQVSPPDSVMRDVSDRLRPLFARTTKNELGLDAPSLRVELVEMKPLQAEIYNVLCRRVRRSIALTQTHAQLSRMGIVVAYLLQAATNPGVLARALAGASPSAVQYPPAPVPPDSPLAEKVVNYARYETPRKFEKLAAMVAENTAAGRKTLVWANFVANLTELHERVLAPYEPALIYGGVPSGDEDAEFVTRERELKRFRKDDDCLVLLANPAAMSEGVSLHEECHDAIYLDRSFNAGHYLQSIDRIHRLGLKPGTETRITFLVSVGTVDEVVDQRVRDKAVRLALMMSDPHLVTMALPDDDAYDDLIDPEDMNALFEHLAAHDD